jgi:transcriptional regulator GlxA family with amidase domain
MGLGPLATFRRNVSLRPLLRLVDAHHDGGMHAQILLFNGFDPLDVVAPFEVLVAGSSAVGGELHVELVSAEGPRAVTGGSSGVPGAGSLTFQATGRLDPSKPGYVIVPGALGPIEGDPDEGMETIPVLLARFGETAAAPLMRHAMDNPEITVATVCGGSLALAMAGLLDGRHANTHHLGVDVLEATGAIPVNARVVDDGDLITAGGVTSGLDLALYLLNRSYGPRIALAVEEMFAFERRGTVWTNTGRQPQAM